MNSIIAIIVLVMITAGAVYRFGRNSKTVEFQKIDIKEGQKINEILEKQRDNRVNNVDDADRLWNEHKKD